MIEKMKGLMIMIKGNNYTIDEKNILAHEFIGLNVTVKGSTDSVRAGTKGIILDETMKTFTIRTEKGDKIVPKAECVFEFDINEKVSVKGNEIIKRPEDRVKEWRN